MRKMSYWIEGVLIGLLPFMCAGAATTGEVSLDTVAVRENGTEGAIRVLGTDSIWTAGCTKNTVYDRNDKTFFDAKDNEGWAGFQTSRPMIPTRLRYKGRPRDNTTNYPRRMKGCLFQGANNPNFSDAVTLHQADPPASWNGLTWQDVVLPLPYSKAFSYFRIIGHLTGNGQEGMCCGNASEVEFFGLSEPEDLTPPDPPIIQNITHLNRVARFSFTKSPRALFYRIEKRFGYQSDEAFSRVMDIAANQIQGDTFFFADPQRLQRKTVYRVSAMITEGGEAGRSECTLVPELQVLSGRVIGTHGSYNNSGNTRDKVFDGDSSTFIDVGATGGAWVGLDLESVQVLRGIRFLPRRGHEGRMKDGLFQIADNEEFLNAQTVHTLTADPGSQEMTEVLFTAPYPKGRYLRFLTKAGDTYCNVSEIEFLGDGTPSVPASDLRASLGDRQTGSVTLNWRLPHSTPFNRIVVQRATAPGGPWQPVTPNGLPPDVTRWSDRPEETGSRPIVQYYYRVLLVHVNPENWKEVKFGAPSNRVTWRRAFWLERDPSDPSRLREGVTLIHQGTLYPNEGHPEGPFENGFDNRPESFVSTSEGGGAIGVRFEKPYKIALVRVMPRYHDSDWTSRLNGAEVWGSQSASPFEEGRPLEGSGPVRQATPATYSEILISDLESYSSLYLKKEEAFFCNLSEMEVYGWDPALEPKDILLPPEAVSLFEDEEGRMRLEWTPGANATAYRIERKVEREGEWTVIENTYPNQVLVDPNSTPDGHYIYRIASMRFNKEKQEWELAYTDDYSTWSYRIGYGTGLYATFFQPYRATYDPDEEVVQVRIDPSVNFDRDNDFFFRENRAPLCAVWNGRLIVPRNGEYTFMMKHDDGGALWIDDRPVINNHWDRDVSEWQIGTLELTEGEHPIRIDYYGGGGIDTCQLKWRGAVPEEIIPITQFIPEEPLLPEGWIGERSFNLPKKGHLSFKPDGSAVIQAGGRDVGGGDEGYHYLWRKVRGDFEATLAYSFPAEVTTPNEAKVMLMVRNALTIGGTPFVAPAARKTFDPERGISYSYGGLIRREASSEIERLGGEWKSGGALNGWLKIRRKGNTLSAFCRFYADDPWRPIGEPVTLAPEALGEELVIGPAVTTGNGEPLEAISIPTFKLSSLGSVILFE